MIALTPEEALTVLKWWANAGDEWEPSALDDEIASRIDIEVETHYLEHQ